MTREEIEKKITALEAEIQQLLAEANRQIGFRQGQIEVYRELLHDDTNRPSEGGDT